jgi:hypothetical protein
LISKGELMTTNTIPDNALEPVLAIGLGGTGLRVLLKAKERLVDTYEDVPEQVRFLLIDTDDYQSTKEDYSGTTLKVSGEVGLDGQGITEFNSEFYHINTKKEKVSEVFKKGDDWLQAFDYNALQKVITNSNQDVIAVGAGTHRPIGRVALFMNYQTVYQTVASAIDQVINKWREIHGEIKTGNEDPKPTIFVVGSAAGGTGAGTFVDILRMIQSMRDERLKATPIEVIAISLGSGTFGNPPNYNNTQTSNTFAVWREMNRLLTVSTNKKMSSTVPRILFAPAPVNRYGQVKEPADFFFLVDAPDRNNNPRAIHVGSVENPYLDLTATPAVADLIVAYTDRQIAPKLRTMQADIRILREKDPYGRGATGVFPFLSFGMHTMIFPEGDVRRSAGIRYCIEFIDELLKQHDAYPASAELASKKEQKLNVNAVSLAQNFSESHLCKDVPNNNFIRLIAASNAKGSLPPARVGLFRRLNTLKWLFSQIGYPSNTEDKKQSNLAEDVESISDQIDTTIDNLRECETYEQCKQWNEIQIGQGPLGNEQIETGNWSSIIFGSNLISGHGEDFRSILTNYVRAILNDRNNDRLFGGRLEFAKQMLHLLDVETKKFVQILDTSTTLQQGKMTSALNSLKNYEQGGRDGSNYKRYNNAFVDYAKARKEYFGVETIKVLVRQLQSVREDTYKMLDEWVQYLKGVRDELIKAQNRHEEMRLIKNQIPVRTYLSATQSKGDKKFVDTDYEKNLYAEYLAKDNSPWQELWRKISWKSNADHSISLMAPFGREDKPTFSVAEIVSRMMQWACTKRGLREMNHELNMVPFRQFATPSHIPLSKRIFEYFEKNATTCANRLSQDNYIASLAPWKSGFLRTGLGVGRLQYGYALPPIADSETTITGFYDNCKSLLTSAMSTVNVARGFNGEPQNPRHAFGLEFTVGFALHHHQRYDDYLKQYQSEVDNGSGRHCMPEEHVAAIDHEPFYQPHSTVYPGLQLSRRLLDPLIVDVMGDKKLLELFVKALVWGIVGRLTKEMVNQFTPDYYLWTERVILTDGVRKTKGALRISFIASANDQIEFLKDIVGNQDLADVKQHLPLVNQLRLLMAIRVFVLAQKGRLIGESTGEDVLDHDKRVEEVAINYTEIDSQVLQLRQGYNETDRQEFYKAWWNKFVDNYKSFEAYKPLADMNLVLARVAFSLMQSEAVEG